MLATFTWSELAEQIVAGLADGSVYASLALALVLIYRSTRAVNFAQGEMATFSTFIAWSLMNHGFSFWAAFPVVLAISFVGGVVVERAVIRPVEDAPVLTIVIITLGLALLLNGLMYIIWGGGDRAFNGGFSSRTIKVAGAHISIQYIGIIGVLAALVLLLALFFRFTKLGLAVRAAATNPDSSRLVGVRVSWMLAFGALVAVVVAMPRLVSDFHTRELAVVGVYFIALIGLNVLTGYSGQISLGHGAFMAIGGYTTAILTVDHGMRDLWTIPIAGVIAGFAGLLFGIPALRLSGLYLAIVTFGVAVS